MKIIYSTWLPPKGYKAITLLRWVVIREDAKERFTAQDFNHERIHYAQEKELFFVGFYILYVFEFLLALLYFHNWHTAYRNISFEVEAYEHQNDLTYLRHRKRFAWNRFDWE